MYNEYDDQYKPITAWGYLGYSILFSLPMIGIICLVAFSFSDKNYNRRNFARSFFCALVIGAISAGILFGLGLFAEILYWMA